MIAMLLENMLDDLGCQVIGPFARVAEALAGIEATANIDVAVLDMLLHGKRSDAIADALTQRNIPFLFSTGYGTSGLCEVHHDRPVLRKPFGPDELSEVLARLLGAGSTKL
jgi:CheY-like chemotaxis protein